MSQYDLDYCDLVLMPQYDLDYCDLGDTSLCHRVCVTGGQHYGLDQMCHHKYISCDFICAHLETFPNTVQCLTAATPLLMMEPSCKNRATL